ncbi:uncharacterized protein PV06_09096 [Exophiala oligosperma]|uniref:Heterokaryon incompatibility domain-containing protein n=1 Tax=Exophiala oligosperma TaxID=215243 RepID=A0A0D2BP60_9EURO|nr:uncharacterized protein PV06_09096 [Exophiala oligosperma]KIW39312.1 hypothetical protein PV06_09096 [Exophiala oligosperma]
MEQSSNIWQPLSNQWSFRVVTVYHGRNHEPIEVFLHEKDLRLEHEYVALSYTWGNAWSQAEIQANGQQHRISENLYEVLKIIRDDDHDINVWIDALSISQVDPVEKSNHIGMIGKIFQQAKDVLAWVGHQSPNGLDLSKLTAVNENHGPRKKSVFRRATEAIVHPELRRTKRYPTTYTDAWMTADYRRRAEIISKLLQRPYFGRTWIVQELIFSKHITFRCGPHTITWEVLMNLIDKIVDYDPECVRDIELPRPDPYYEDQIEMLTANPRFDRLMFIRGCRRSHAANDLGLGLIDSINIFANTSQSLPHDRVYALLELVQKKGSLQPLQPNYELKMSQLFVQVFRTRSCVHPGELFAPEPGPLPKPWKWNSTAFDQLVGSRSVIAACLLSDLRISREQALDALKELQECARQDQCARADDDLFAVANAFHVLYGYPEEGNHGRFRQALYAALCDALPPDWIRKQAQRWFDNLLIVLPGYFDSSDESLGLDVSVLLKAFDDERRP